MLARLPDPSHDWCLFLDVDGTLIELQETPSAVFVGDELKQLVMEASRRLGGALALVSGRSIEVLDELFFPLELPAAGLHGVERRLASGERRGQSYRDAALASARAKLEAFVASHPGTLLEDKGRALAVHFRLAPELRDEHAARRGGSRARPGPRLSRPGRQNGIRD